MRLKHYIAERELGALLEGKAQIHSKYVVTDKLTVNDVKTVQTNMWFDGVVDKQFNNTYTDWVLHEMVRLGVGKDGLANFDRKHNAIMHDAINSAKFHYYLNRRKIVKKMLSYERGNKRIDWINILKGELKAHATKQKTTGLGGKYDRVYAANGFEIFACIDWESVKAIGSAADWCIRREEKYWNDYNRGHNFFVVVDHHRGKMKGNGMEDTLRKVCIQLVRSTGQLTVWTYDDHSMTLNDYVYAIQDVLTEKDATSIGRVLDTELVGFESEFDNEDKIRQEAAAEYDELMAAMEKWAGEYESEVQYITAELTKEMEEIIHKKYKEMDDALLGDDRSKLQDEINELKDLLKGGTESVEIYYDEIKPATERKYYDFKEYKDSVQPKWGVPEMCVVEIPNMLGEWWEDHGYMQTTACAAINDWAINDNPHSWDDLPDPHTYDV